MFILKHFVLHLEVTVILQWFQGGFQSWEKLGVGETSSKSCWIKSNVVISPLIAWLSVWPHFTWKTKSIYSKDFATIGL